MAKKNAGFGLVNLNSWAVRCLSFFLFILAKTENLSELLYPLWIQSFIIFAGT